ncbi:phage tail tube protein [Jatrophihabitans sp. DSM 45814]
MVSAQDASIGFGTETTFKTAVTTNRWLEYVDESLDWNKNVKQGKGLRVGGRVARSGRRTVPTADGGGDFTTECVSKGMGLLFSYLLGSGVSTLVAGSTFQQVFTLADLLPSFTLQKGLPHVNADGSFTVDPYTFFGCTADSFELDFTSGDILSLKATIDAADLTTATAYAAPSYAAAPNLFHFANASLSSGTLTPPTATALASATTQIADIRSGSLTLNHNTAQDRYNFGGGGRKSKPTVGERDIACKLVGEYDSTAYRDAVLNETPMCLLFNYTASSLSTGLETLQVVVPEVKFDSELPKTNGTDLITQSMSGVGLDNLTAAQPIWIVLRTSDSAL